MISSTLKSLKINTIIQLKTYLKKETVVISDDGLNLSAIFLNQLPLQQH